LLLVHQKKHFEMEQALRESEERYRSVICAMKEGVMVWDADGVITAFNSSAESILGVSGDRLISTSSNRQPAQLIHADGLPFPEDEYPHRIALQTGHPQNDVVMGVYKSDGALVWLSVNAQPLFKPGSPKPYGVLATFANITEPKTTMEALISERDLLRTLIDSTPDYIFIKDAEGKFVISNEAHARAGNVTANELIGKTAFDLFPPDLAEQFHTDDMEIIESGQELLNLERTTVDAQGNFKTVLTSKVPLRSREGRITGLVGISRDITERKIVERQALELAAERERMKVLQRFIGDLSHDFRTPLTIINNSIYLLRKITDPERQQGQLDKLEAQVIRMDDLLGDLLKMDHLVHGDSPYSFVPLDLNALVSEVAAVFEVSAAEKSQILQFKPDSKVPLVMADYDQLKQVIASVIENAVHYTPETGKILVYTEVQNQHVAVVVKDTGIGISEEDWPHIFEPFYRADQARSTTNGRSGLGLAIAKHIVEAHNGSIEVQSAFGYGSTFTILLPTIRD
jgi:PAS domain S-box-containing protein